MANVKICPACGNKNTASSVFCGNCNYPLAEVETTSDVPPPEPAPIPAAGPPDLVCECGARLPSSATQCEYCGNVMPAALVTPSAGDYHLRWPWGATTPIRGRVFIGRVPPVVDELARRLEQEYPNVSRIHAELIAKDSGMYLRDHHSLNGTFLNGNRVEPEQDVLVPANATIRFASRLEAKLVLNVEEEPL